MRLEPTFAHVLGVPLEELLPVVLGFGAVAYLRLRLNFGRVPRMVGGALRSLYDRIAVTRQEAG